MVWLQRQWMDWQRTDDRKTTPEGGYNLSQNMVLALAKTGDTQRNSTWIYHPTWRSGKELDHGNSGKATKKCIIPSLKQKHTHTTPIQKIVLVIIRKQMTSNWEGNTRREKSRRFDYLHEWNPVSIDWSFIALQKYLLFLLKYLVPLKNNKILKTIKKT